MSLRMTAMRASFLALPSATAGRKAGPPRCLRLHSPASATFDPFCGPVPAFRFDPVIGDTLSGVIGDTLIQCFSRL